jgi:carboxyl-terminal processing protease
MDCRQGLMLAFCATLVWHTPAAVAQDVRDMGLEAREYLEYALGLMEAQALNRDKVDWAEVRATAYRNAAGAQHTRDTYRAIVGALASLNDSHSRFLPPMSELPAELGMVNWARPEPASKRLGERVAYVAVPSFSGPGADQFAGLILDLVFEVDGPEVCGWIVDVRGNTGGNMWPMLQGLSPILGEGVPGYFVPPEGEWTAWRIERRLVAGRKLVRGQGAVAILHDRQTASSGEAVVVAFRGRSETRSFGQRTGGLSTANRTIAMPDGATLLLTVSEFADRDRNVYGKAIDPDEYVFEGVPKEQLVEVAKEWLLRQPACSGDQERAG